MPIQTAYDSLTNISGSPFGFKNRIINGAMVIDQRNNGASVTPGVGATYFTDRFAAELTTSSALTFQQVSDAPAGFTNSLKITVASSTAVSTGTNNNLFQIIEGYNIADLGWGTASAKSVTISFWAKSSITGTYSLHMRNLGDSYFYIATYTIDAANTWEYKTLTIPGPTVGTWNTTNSRGVLVGFVNLGNGSTFEGTAGSWQSGVKCATSGSVDFCAQANGATFFITGVQLEKGSQSTPFDYRPYTTELQLCQRYYYKLSSDSANAATLMAPGVAYSTTQTAQHLCAFPVTMRSRPTASISGTIALYVSSLVTTITGIATQNSSTTQGTLNFQVASGLSVGTYYTVICQNTTGFIDFAAEV